MRATVRGPATWCCLVGVVPINQMEGLVCRWHTVRFARQSTDSSKIAISPSGDVLDDDAGALELKRAPDAARVSSIFLLRAKIVKDMARLPILKVLQAETRSLSCLSGVCVELSV